MGVTVLSSAPFDYLYAYPPIVEYKATWSADWIFDPELEVIGAHVCTGAAGVDSLTIRRVFGVVKQPYEATGDWRPSYGPAAGWWVRVGIMGPGGYVQQWLGRFSSYGQRPDGAASNGPTGEEQWVAYGGLQILNKYYLSRSFWDHDGTVRDIGWIPSMNIQDDDGTLTGNRTAEVNSETGCYMYGGTDKWSNLDYLDYLCACFLDESAGDGPSWKVTGATNAIQNMQDSVKFQGTQTLLEIVRKLVPIERGVDFLVGPTDEGFEILIFTLTPQSVSFGNFTLPSNANTVRIEADDAKDIRELTLEESEDWGFKVVRVLGKRIVACLSLCGENATHTQYGAHPYAGSLVQKWSGTLEDDYKAGVSGSAEENDAFRANEKFRQVYTCYGAPRDWSWHGADAALTLTSLGTEVTGGADWQGLVRKTLDWIPLLEGVDYSTNPETASQAANHQPEYRKPMVWVAEENPENASAYVYQPAAINGVTVSVPQLDWGIGLRASPQHLLAYDHWDDAEATGDEPIYDYSATVCTIAVETDQRWGFQMAMPDASASGGVYEVEVDDAELWVLSPNTVVGTDEDGQYQLSGTEYRILRQDTDRVMAAMAGILVRYYSSRCKAVMSVEGLLPWAGLLGRVLTYVQAGGMSQSIQSIITTVTWSQTSTGQTTTIHTGHSG